MFLKIKGFASADGGVDSDHAPQKFVGGIVVFYADHSPEAGKKPEVAQPEFQLFPCLQERYIKWGLPKIKRIIF